MDNNMKNMKARDIMTSPVIMVSEDTPVSEFSARLLESGIKGMPVTDGSGKLTGIITRTDLLVYEMKKELSSLYEEGLHEIFDDYKNSEGWKLFSGEEPENVRSSTVKDIMVHTVITANEDDDVFGICRTMRDRKINHMLIMDGNDVKGIITSRDIISLVADFGE